MHASASFLVDGVNLCIASIQLTYWLLWGGSLALTLTLVTLLLTRWGHSRPLHKCAVLSLIVHLIFAFLTMTVRIVNDGGGGGGGGGPPIHVRIVDEPATSTTHAVASKGMETPAPEEFAEVAAPALLEPPPPKEAELPAKLKPQTSVDESPLPPSIAKAPPKEQAKEKEPVEPKVETEQPPAVAKTNASNPKEQSKDPTPSPPAIAHTAAASTVPAEAVAAPAVGVMAATASAPATAATPASTTAATTILAGGTYSLRSAPGRLSVVAGQGGNAETEAAVAAALRWLAINQAKDGRWDAVQYGAGHEEMTLGQNRGGAGRGADTGITALALLSFLGAGHSHVQGEYQENVRGGLDFLLRSQAADGSLFGEATLYAQMYCHSMATFALAEAQAMTGDRRLAGAAMKAINFSVAAQNTLTGGWRYRPGDTGDTSQLGWQIMALASAKRAGIDVPDVTWTRVDRFLRTVQRGERGGLASYRPDSPVSTSMTAEALYCRLVLQEMSDTKLVEPAALEATTQLLAVPPSSERFNLYYWYYATLALHHRQNRNDAAKSAWRAWNDGMTVTLTKSQRTDGNDAGSWDSTTMWGGYGGRIYTTAMATMCLEVYYRYAPTPARDGTWSASRPQSLPAPR